MCKGQTVLDGTELGSALALDRLQEDPPLGERRGRGREELVQQDVAELQPLALLDRQDQADVLAEDLLERLPGLVVAHDDALVGAELDLRAALAREDGLELALALEAGREERGQRARDEAEARTG